MTNLVGLRQMVGSLETMISQVTDRLAKDDDYCGLMAIDKAILRLSDGDASLKLELTEIRNRLERKLTARREYRALRVANVMITQLSEDLEQTMRWASDDTSGNSVPPTIVTHVEMNTPAADQIPFIPLQEDEVISPIKPEIRIPATTPPPSAVPPVASSTANESSNSALAESIADVSSRAEDRAKAIFEGLGRHSRRAA
jgi:hypothetical protein